LTELDHDGARPQATNRFMLLKAKALDIFNFGERHDIISNRRLFWSQSRSGLFANEKNFVPCRESKHNSSVSNRRQVVTLTAPLGLSQHTDLQSNVSTIVLRCYK